ncbi:16S rRNA (cytosine(1402)-N(4))-methyltransferase RsmH [Haloferula sp.]|uniref:16S rRNA (cytosine(1402)-N(4))-methyltransferase RsmH n=1 Tax=Haloferula sp. TaxID=2497595 RepID=UPI00329C3BD4
MSAASDSGAASGSGYHVSVLPRETTEWMEAGEGKFIIDGTLGGGGHSEAFLKAGARVLGVDRDPEALAHASKRLSVYGDRFRTWQGNFADLGDYPEGQGGERADGLLLDLGVSSRQLDAAERGFSFRGEGPLDMRMGPATELTAAEVVNNWSEDDLLKILWEYGEERKARRIVRAILARRDERPFETTTDLADCIEKAVGRSGRTHPGTKTFQAIRIAVNDELGSLERALEKSVDLLKPGGRLLVITFHSLEDRMVKRFMQERSKVWLDQPDWPEPRPNPRRAFRLPQRKAIAPSDQEIQVNPRARSAKLRVAELLDPAQIHP